MKSAMTITIALSASFAFLFYCGYLLLNAETVWLNFALFKLRHGKIELEKQTKKAWRNLAW